MTTPSGKEGCEAKYLRLPKKHKLITINGTLDESSFQSLLILVGDLKAKDPTNADADCDRAIIFEAMKQPFAARQSIAEALRINPKHARALQLRQDIFPAWQPAQSSLVESPDGNIHESDTLLSKARLDSLKALTNDILSSRVQGDFIECGVAGGGSLTVIARELAKQPDPSRRCIGLDTFWGMPEPSADDTADGTHAQLTGWGQGTCSSGGSDRIHALLRQHNLENNVELIEGLFEVTLPKLRKEMLHQKRSIAFLHCDADWYSSTACIAKNLFDLITPGGIIQVDDYGHWDGCKKAIDEALGHLNPKPVLHHIDYTGRWFTMPAGYKHPE